MNTESHSQFVQSYVSAAAQAGSYIGATAKQAAYLANLEWQLGERRLFEGRLLKRECSIMIDYAKRNVAKLAA